MINVLFMHTGGNSIRGSEVCLINLLNYIDKDHFKPTLICNNNELVHLIDSFEFNSYLMNYPEITFDKKFKIEIVKYLKSLFFVYKLIKENKIDIIYSNSGLPCQLGIVLSKLLKIPSICHLHASHSKRYPWMWLFKFADKVIFVSEEIKNELTRKVFFSGKTSVVYNGIDTINRFYPPSSKSNILRKKHGINENDIIIGQVGKLINEKGVDILIKAFEKLNPQKNNLKLIFIGDSDSRNEYINMINDCGLNGFVIFVGQVNNVEEYYREVIDINVLASRTEAFGLSLIESAACGLPNIGSNCGGIPEIIDHGINGLLFEVGNSEDLTLNIKKLIYDNSLREKMGEKGRAKVERLFTLDKYVKNIEKEIIDLKDRKSYS